MTAIPHQHDDTSSHAAPFTGPAYQAYRILQIAFVAAPIISGLDKFLDRLVDWDKYLAPQMTQLLASPHNFMMAVGCIEIIAGVGIALKPRFVAYVVALWLAGIIGNLLLLGQYYDIALRDLGLCLGAIALARLAVNYDFGPVGGLMSRR